MAAVIVRKVFDNYDKDLTNSPTSYILSFNRFALKVVNQLFYNWEMSGLLVASYLLNLSDHSSAKANIKTINIAFL